MGTFLICLSCREYLTDFKLGFNMQNTTFKQYSSNILPSPTTVVHTIKNPGAFGGFWSLKSIFRLKNLEELKTFTKNSLETSKKTSLGGVFFSETSNRSECSRKRFIRFKKF
jgi:hypothetical protein